MSQLPEWLWPVEDEVAVQEAERLIEETHNTLRKMEAEMQVQQALSQNLTSKTEKLKSSMNDKIHSLEKELKNISEPKDAALPSEKQQKSQKLFLSKQPQGTRINEQRSGVPLIIPESKANVSFTTSQQPYQQNRRHKSSSNSAEQVVISAREKVQEALAMARHVSASLEQHVSTSTQPSKPLSISQVTNVGIFEVKSQAEKKIQNPKPRLQQALLPSVSIKRGLEKQSVLSIQVPPGEKTVTPNVSVYNIKHERVTKPEDIAKKPKSCTQNEDNHKCATSDLSLENTVAQLSKQLMEVEELREINQTQVNHVLRYLLSRVCSGSQSQKRTNTAQDKSSHIDPKETPETPVSTTSSESSKYPIAYDSLSRFLETYKKAAEHNMVAKKRAAERRQKEITKQKKEIQQMQNTNENHLLIGPLRQAVRLKGSDLHSSTPQYDNPNNFSWESDGFERNRSPVENFEKEFSTNKPISNDSSSSHIYSAPEEEKHTSYDTSLPSVKVPSGGISHDEYEDDWEEDHNGQQSSDLELKINETSVGDRELLKLLSSTNSSSSEQQTHKSLDIEFMSLNLNLPDPQTEHKENPLSVNEDVIRPQEEVSADNSCKLAQKAQDDDVFVNKEAEGVKNHNSNGIAEENPHMEKDQKDSDHVHDVRDPYSVRTDAIQNKSKARIHSSNSSSSEAEVNYEPRRPPRSSKRWDLKLREDLQLQSAILLNWQLENQRKSRDQESGLSKDNHSLCNKEQGIIDVEKRWQKTLDELDLRLKTIEENEKINRIANEIKQQIKEEQSKIAVEIKLAEDRHKTCTNEDKISQTESKVVLKDQTVQTSPMKPLVPDAKELVRKVTVPNYGIPLVLPKTLSALGRHLPSPNHNEDLTSELLAYGRMGILSSVSTGRKSSKSPSPSSTSSHTQQSSIMVSMSDGELRSSESESCSCSEGEFCVCGRKRCSERGPPDGSQTFSDGENFLRDISQGEIPPGKINSILKDTSFGEITSHGTGGFLMESLDLVEESIDSEDIEWDLR